MGPDCGCDRWSLPICLHWRRSARSPAVQAWWGEPQPGDLEPPADGDLLVIEVDGRVAGAIQYEEVSDPQYRSAGLDIFLGAAWQGRGLGREAVALLAGYLIESGATIASRSTPPQPTSERSAATRPWGSRAWVSCGSTSGPPTAPGTTGC